MGFRPVAQLHRRLAITAGPRLLSRAMWMPTATRGFEIHAYVRNSDKPDSVLPNEPGISIDTLRT